MKNIINKIIYSALGLMFVVAFLAPTGVFAASFNDDVQDYDTLRVGNYTQNPNSNNSQWGTSVSAIAGEAVSFAIYYHNTSDEIARNVRVRLSPKNTNLGMNHSFTAYVWADNAPQVIGTATVNLSSNQTIDYANAIAWYPNQGTLGNYPLLNNQTRSDIFTQEGLYIGDLAPGWGTQGNVTLTFWVSSDSQGQQASVTTNSATSIGQNSATLNAYVNPNNTSDTTRWFEYGTTQSFGYSTSHQNQASSASNFNAYVSGLSQNTTYYFRAVAQNSYGTTYGSILSFSTSSGQQDQAPSVTTNSATNINQSNVTLNCYVNPNNTSDTSRWFEYGTSQSFGYSTSHQNQGSSASNFNAYVSGLSQNTTYYFRCLAQNNQGTTYGNTLTFYTGGGTNNSLPSVTTYSADGIGETFASLKAYVNTNNTSDTTRWFEWGTESWALNNSTIKIGQGSNSSNFSASISGLSRNETYYFRAVAKNSQGTVYGAVQSFTTIGTNNQRAFVSTYNASNIQNNSATLNGYTNPYNTNDTVRWFEYGTTQSLGNTTNRISHGSTASNFSDYVSGLTNNTTYYFRAVAQNNQGTSYGNILSFTTGGTVIVARAPEAITNLAINIGQTSARLNGLAIVTANEFTKGWFEYGRTQSLGNRTVSEGLGTAPSMSFKYSMFGLSSNTTYYYRAVVQNDKGIDYGDILTFRTNSVVITPRPDTLTREVSIEKRVENIVNSNGTDTRIEALRGDLIRFTITVKNTGDYTLEDVEVKDRVPYYLEFANAEDENMNEDTQREVVWFVGDMRPGDREEVTLDMIVTGDARVNSTIENIAQIESKRLTKTSNKVEIEVVDKTPNLAAATFFGGNGFLPDTLVEWLLLIILIFILVVLSRVLYGQYEDRKKKKAEKK